MTSMINIAGILVFALVVIAIVLVGLRLSVATEPNKATAAKDRPKPGLRRRLVSAGAFVAVLIVYGLAVEIQIAYGAPVGERNGRAVEVLEADACERPLLGLGLARTCEVTGSWSDMSPGTYLELRESIEVDTGDTIAPGDLVAKYTATGWTLWIQLRGSDGQWRSVDDEDRPNLVWLPLAATALAGLAASTGARALMR